MKHPAPSSLRAALGALLLALSSWAGAVDGVSSDTILLGMSTPPSGEAGAHGRR